jgi:periplasmic copper chaperone A
MINMLFARARTRPLICASLFAPVLVLCGSALAGQAPGTVPPAPPAAAPAAPPAATVPPGDPVARARAAALAAKANVDLFDAWTRASGNATAAPIYLRMVSVKDPDRLVGVEAAIAQRVELRDDAAQGAARVMAVPALDLPAGGTVNFAPGGKYLQLVGLKAPLKEGDSFLITLKFDKAGSSSTPVKILATGATSLPPINSGRQGDTTAGVSQR